ncbi:MULTISPECIES: primosomal replication protein N [Thauera]|uniref:primosomal replication protein N n=1 Tax=unclassified Thauera TaxID=2609274 RepID=UPI0002D0FC2E|nr:MULTISPECIES: primosomal replication protein N [Thauera]ENO80672.1 primosomal replication protein N [Thauera sp. 27]ENO91016.1 primosomal replication protein N [Thauera sp. 28]MDG3065772.1 primosomal replication protein N [Thauera mechernichensis]WBL64911.1 primosomal replication protein N [Thauera sp. WB-2]HAG75689.1 primosomal replication protein N [Thauera sp.]
MPEPGLNQLRIDARVAEVLPLRRTPAGVPVASCTLAHESKQIEAGLSRDVSVELQAVAVGDLAAVLAVAAPGCAIRATGFMAARSMRSRSPVLHLNTIEFLEGN